MNGYVVGSVKDQVPPNYPSTAAKVELRQGTTLKRTLYLTKAMGDEYWYYSTAIAPGKYAMKAYDTTVIPNYLYLDTPTADVKEAQPFTANFERFAPP